MVTIEVSENDRGQLQVSINDLDNRFAGHGYRILGPKFDGTGRLLARRILEERDAKEIRQYLEAVR